MTQPNRDLPLIPWNTAWQPFNPGAADITGIREAQSPPASASPTLPPRPENWLPEINSDNFLLNSPEEMWAFTRHCESHGWLSFPPNLPITSQMADTVRLREEAREIVECALRRRWATRPAAWSPARNRRPCRTRNRIYGFHFYNQLGSCIRCGSRIPRANRCIQPLQTKSQRLN